MKTTLFWNVDTQYDFMDRQGALYVQGAEEIVGNLRELTRLAAREDLKVVNTADWHTEDSREISDDPDFITTFPPHCLAGTPGAEYIDATKPFDPYVINHSDAEFDEESIGTHRNIVLYKDEFDAFDARGGPHTDKVLDIISPERAVVYGVATNVCVDYAVMGLLERGVDVIVPTDAIKELPGLPLEEVLEKWESSGAKLVKTVEVERYV